MRVTLTGDGPCIVTVGVPLTEEEIVNDDEGAARSWGEVLRCPLQGWYALCLCGQSKNQPIGDGTHAEVGFYGTETARDEPCLRRPRLFPGPVLALEEYEGIGTRARFRMRADRV